MKAVSAHVDIAAHHMQRESGRRPQLWRRTLQSLAMATAISLSGTVLAGYPQKPVEVIISFPPAGATDTLARGVAQGLSEKLGQNVVVQNRPGAGGAIGLNAAARAKPDGHYLYLAATTNQAIAAAIYGNQEKSLLRDFVPIGQVGIAPHALVVPADLPVKSAKDLMAYLKAKPGQYNFASQGIGTLSHLEGELFVNANKLELTHVPYKGSALALPDLANGTATMMFDSLTGSMPMVQAGKLRYLAVASRSRVSLRPDVPTLEEAGIPGVVADNVFGLFAPRGVPDEIIGQIAKALESVLADPALKERLAKQGSEIGFAPADQLARTIAAEHEYWAGVVKDANVHM